MSKKRSVEPALLWLAAMLLLALALRVYRLDAQSLWYDEAVTAQVASRGIAELTRWTADDIQPPLYYYLVAGWTRLAGRSEWALRFPSAFFGVLTVVMLWATARRLFGQGETGRWAAGIASLLTALLPLYIYYAQEARMYTLLTFLGVLAGYALLRAGVRGQEAGGRGQGSGVRRQEAGGGREEAGGRGQGSGVRSQESGGRRQEAGGRQYSAVGNFRAVPHAGRSATAHESGRRSSLRPGTSPGARVCRTESSKWWAVFVLAAVALLYTHYFGVFLLMAYGVCWAVYHAKRAVQAGTTGRHWAAFGLSVLMIILLYLPWLPAMLNRYRADTSYWQGALKLGEALRHVAINFTVAAPEMMLEGTALRLLPLFGVAVALALIALFWRGRYAGQAGILLAVLILPVIAVLVLASRTPKFNPRYLMLASPAYLLLLTGGMAVLGWGCGEAQGRGDAGTRGHGDAGTRGREDAETRRRGDAGTRGRGDTGTRGRGDTGTRRRGERGAVALGVTGFLVVVSLLSIHNWFTDPAFTKAQWRELTAFVRQERRTDEAVLLVSGHAYPAWDYYGPDIPVVRLPQIEILDVNRVLDFSVGRELNVALADKKGAWLVGWQDEVVDPVGIVPFLLTRAGVEEEVPRSFWHLKLRRWRLLPGAGFPAEPQPQHPDGANFDHKLALLGWDEPAAGEITVYWRVLNTLTQDYQVSVAVEDAAGNRLGQWDGRPAGYHYPTFRWYPGQVLFGRYPLSLPASAPPGDYIVALTVYSSAEPSGLDIRDEADNPAGKHVRLGPIRVK